MADRVDSMRIGTQGYSGLYELSPVLIFGTNIPQVSKVWANQLRIQGLADGELTLLSGIHP